MVGKKKKNEHHNWILHIWISLNTNFQLKLTVLIFGTKFAWKRYFQSKTKNRHHPWILHIQISLSIKFHFEQFRIFGPGLPKKDLWSKTEKVNFIIKFCIFELVLVPNFSLNWGPNLSKEDFCGLKQKKWTLPLNSAYSN